MKAFYKLIGIVLVVSVITGCSGGSGDSSSTVKSESTTNTTDDSSYSENIKEDNTAYDIPVIDESSKQIYLDAINNARAVTQDCGEYGVKDAVPALTWNDALYKAAYEHSEDLAESDTFAHDGSGTESDWTAQVQDLESGSTMRDRIENNGYTNWRKIGENIAAGSLRDTAQEAVDAWIESDGHCKNLMNPDYKNVGMGHVEKDGSTYIHYWTQNFGAQ